MNKKLAAIALLILVALPFVALCDHSSSSVEQPRVDAEGAAPLQPPKQTLDPPTVGSEVREAVASSVAESGTAAGSTLPTKGSLRVHVATLRDVPLADIGVGLERRRNSQNLVAQPEFVRTDAHGDVIFEDLAPNAYTVRIDRGLQYSADVVAGAQAEVLVKLFGIDVMGLVVDEQGSPIADATIWRCEPQRVEGVKLTRTNARGEFSLEACNGPWLKARKPGFAPSVTAPLPQGGDGRCEMRLVLESEAGEVVGRVVDFGGNPIPNAVVTFHRQGATSGPREESVAQLVPAHVRGAADGSFRCEEVPRGSVIVAAITTDSERAPVSELVEVGAAPIHLELRMGRGATLEGSITDGGTPMVQCTVIVACQKSELPMSTWFQLVGMRTTMPDAEGHYRIGGIIPGNMEVRVDSRAVKSMGESFGFHTMSVKEGELVHWDADYSAVQHAPFVIDIEPKRAPGLSGEWHVLVMTAGPGRGDSASAKSDESGQARFERLADGHYSAVVSCSYSTEEVHQYEWLPMLKREFDLSEQRLSLRIPDEMLRLVPVRGRLVDAEGKALRARILRLQTDVFPGQVYFQATTDRRGGFAFAGLAAGRYTLELLDVRPAKVVGEFTVVGDRAENLGDLTVQ